MELCTAKASGVFAGRVLGFHSFVKHNLVAGLLRRCGKTAAVPAPPKVRRLGEDALVVDVDALLLKTKPGAAFPPFFLVAVEAGGFARGLVLLVLYPVLRLLSHEASMRAMAMVTFCGLRRDQAARAGRAVLPKYFFREAADMDALKAVGALPKAVKVAAVSRSFPTVMVETFLKEYVGFDAVVGRDVNGSPRYFSGVIKNDGELDAEERLELVLKQTEKGDSGKYPKPMVFHDGRLAFTPTPAAALAMYIYLPFAVVLAVVRIAIYVLLPWRVSGVVAALTGVRVRVTGAIPTADGDGVGRRLYACNHRTLLDAVAVACALRRPVASVSYSLGRLSELLSPIPLRRLTRNRDEDRRRMASMLARGDVVVCPEGTTCREPYLLRFSPLFAELAGEVTPVAMDAHTSVFYATSTSPIAKSFDSVFFLMNPRPEYHVQFLEPVNTRTAGAASRWPTTCSACSPAHSASRGRRLRGKTSTCCSPGTKGSSPPRESRASLA
ncbi:hypothetical protein ACP70R_010563 [Stipagrostis hirtigluma subsp. patula]